MAIVLEKSGYDIHHERIGNDGCVSWPMAVHSYSPWGPLSHETFTYIVHQVRDPLAVMTSWFINLPDLTRDEWVFVRRHIPEIEESDSLVVQCAKYWYYWNLLVEKQASWRYRIEDIFDILPEFREHSGVTITKEALEQTPTNTNNWKQITDKLSWKYLQLHIPPDLYQNIKEMSLRYGYPESD